MRQCYSIRDYSERVNAAADAIESRGRLMQGAREVFKWDESTGLNAEALNAHAGIGTVATSLIVNTVHAAGCPVATRTTDEWHACTCNRMHESPLVRIGQGDYTRDYTCD